MHQVDPYILGEKARSVITAYTALPFHVPVSCPYFNNRRRKTRGGLRVLKGKGSPAEIVEEAQIFSKLTHSYIESLPADKVKEFLVENDLGIDCSGFAYHVLNAHAEEKTGKSLTSYMTSIRPGIIGSFLARLRPAENLGVNSFRSDTNSTTISIADAKAGDVITFIGTGKEKTYNHILVITALEKNSTGTKISYAHSYIWPSDGLNKHGVRSGEIVVSGNDLLLGVWTEQCKTAGENYTFESAKNAAEVSVRRLKFNID